MKKHKIAVGIELFLFSIIVSILGTYAAGSNPPSEGVRYTNNGQATVQGALNDLYGKVVYGNASAGDILSEKTALIGGNKVTGTMSNQGGKTVSASTVTKSGTDALIKVPTTGYYNTSSSLKVPISTLQDTIGGGIAHQIIYRYTGSSESVTYEFDTSYKNVVIVAGGSNDPTNQFSATGATFTTVGTQYLETTSPAKLGLGMYYSLNVPKGTKITLSLKGNYKHFTIYAFDGIEAINGKTLVSGKPSPGSDSGNRITLFNASTESTKAAFCVTRLGTAGDAAGLITLISNGKTSATVTHLTTNPGNLRDNFVNAALITNLSSTDSISVTPGTQGSMPTICMKLQ